MPWSPMVSTPRITEGEVYDEALLGSVPGGAFAFRVFLDYTLLSKEDDYAFTYSTCW